MSVSHAEAASALREVEQTTRRSAELRAYSHASPHLLLWGAIWIVGYVAMGLAPRDIWGLLWLPLDAVGFVGSTLIASRAHRRGPAASADGERSKLPIMVALMLFVALFIACVYIVFQPRTADPYLVFPALVIGLVYVLAGAWKMPRIAAIGAAVFLLTMAGFFLLKPWLPFWIAAVGGGGLVLGGLWLRKA